MHKALMHDCNYLFAVTELLIVNYEFAWVLIMFCITHEGPFHLYHLATVQQAPESGAQSGTYRAEGEEDSSLFHK